MLRVIGLTMLAVILGLVGWEAHNAYFLQHQYYLDMLTTGQHWQLIIGLLLISLVPLHTFFIKKEFSLKSLMRTSIITFLGGSFIYMMTKLDFQVSMVRTVIFSINTLIFLALIGVMIVGLYTLGTWMYTHVFKQNIDTWSDILLAFGLGLGGFLLINYLLITTQLFFRPIAWLQLIGLIVVSILYKDSRKATSQIISNSVTTLRQLPLSMKIFFGILISISVVYVLFSFNLAYIPYSTAWDANHAYMFFPKVWALNNGIFFRDGPIAPPHLWMVYISYWFSLWKPFTNFTIAPDTVAIMMNNVSGWFALVFGIGASSRVISYIRSTVSTMDDQQEMLSIAISWTLLLLWLMSGMGAFLVFVDNKTDLGVMSLSMLAIIAGFGFIHKLQFQQHATRSIRDNIPALLSGFFFALAVLSKPTAFQDVILFALFFIGIFFGISGLVGIFLLVLAVLGKAETMSIIFYISKNVATYLGIAGLGATVVQFFVSLKQKTLHYIKPLCYWSLTIIGLLLIVKSSYLTVFHLINNSFDLTTIVKGTLLSQLPSDQTQPKTSIQTPMLVADTYSGAVSPDEIASYYSSITPRIAPAQCNLQSAGLTRDNLYANLGTVEGGGLIEDLGRYIGFGQRSFQHPSTRSKAEQNSYGSIKLGYHLLALAFPKAGCFSLNATADALCENPSTRQSASNIQKLMATITPGSNQYLFLEGLLEKYKQLETETDPTTQQLILSTIEKHVQTYITSNVVTVQHDKGHPTISIPYAFLTPLNVIFNWSLQNHSSYYTDIGFIWILALVLLVAGLIASIYRRQKTMIVLHLITLCGWILWWFIASGIIWYAVGLIAWTTFCNALFLGSLVHSESKLYRKTIIITIFSILGLALSGQTLYNMVRMASQGGDGQGGGMLSPMSAYKGNVGDEQVFVINNQRGIQAVNRRKYQYNANDVFKVQFGHYQPTLEHLKNRQDDQGILIAGTYLQYFLQNQNNVVPDGLLTDLWKRGSDNNTCNLSLRLDDKNIHYIVIDPNIGSVVMGEGNATLFDRFMAKIDTESQTIIEHGAMTMLVQMVNDGYLRLVHTNNIGAKYAYTLSDTELNAAIQAFPDPTTKAYLLQSFQSDPILFRAQLAAPRFFGTQTYQVLTNFIYYLLLNRLQSEVGIRDIADIFGKIINTAKITKSIHLITNGAVADITPLNKELTDDERFVLGYYMIINNYIQANKHNEVNNIVSDIYQASIAGGSQLITFERL